MDASYADAVQMLQRTRDQYDTEAAWLGACEFVAHKFDKTRREVVDKVLELEALKNVNT